MIEEDKLIEDQFKTLPAELQLAINAVPWKLLVKEIAALNQLTAEQSENLERETMFILYGFENPADYVKNIMQEVPLSEEIAAAVTEEVSEKILAAIAAKVEESEENLSDSNLPMVEEGEIAHEVPHVEQVTQPIIPQIAEPIVTKVVPEQPIARPPHYPGGIDPYREPLQ